jgi:hypothetical protein
MNNLDLGGHLNFHIISPHHGAEPTPISCASVVYPSLGA